MAFVEHVGMKQAARVNKRDVRTWIDQDKKGPTRKDGSYSLRKWSPRTKKDDAICSVYLWGIREGHQVKNPRSVPRRYTQAGQWRFDPYLVHNG